MGKSFCSASAGFLAAAAFVSIALPSLMLIGSGDFDLEFALKGPVGFFPFVLIVVVVFGVPTFLLLRRFKPGHWSMPLAAGAFLGVLLLLTLDLVLGGESTPLFVLIIVLLSAASAFVFWLVWRWADERAGAWCPR
jgi:hypothetical protein